MSFNNFPMLAGLTREDYIKWLEKGKPGLTPEIRRLGMTMIPPRPPVERVLRPLFQRSSPDNNEERSLLIYFMIGAFISFLILAILELVA